MHEFSIAQSMLDAVLDQARRHDVAAVKAVRLRIGALAGVVEEALTFAWEALAADTPAAASRLDVEHVAVACYCAHCEKEFETEAISYRCPSCHALSADLRRGRELQLVSIEVE